MASPPSHLIIGAGVFGASTAYHLIQQDARARIRLVDRTPYPCALGASWDWNKVVRADYGDVFYMEKALEAVRLWRTDPFYRSFYHETGLVRIDRAGRGRRMVENYGKLGTGVVPELVEPEEFRRRYYGGVFSETNFEGVDEVFVNSTSGWAEAGKALKAVIDAAVAAGVEYVVGDVTSLTFDEMGGCTGVRMANGSVLSADKIIMSTGAGTAKLLADSAPEKPELQVGNRMVAACVITGIAKLSPQEGKKYASIPVAIHAMDGVKGEVLPLPPEDGSPKAKFCRDETFRNTTAHVTSKQSFSTPPTTPDQDQYSPSASLKARLDIVVAGFLGSKAHDAQISTYRVCWDAITPNQDFVICAHPHCGNLFVATGGSFHGWKFLPTVGRYVVDLLEGRLEVALVKRWAWDRSDEGEVHGGLVPVLELSDA